MSEQITLTVPAVIPEKITTSYKIIRLLLEIEDKHFILAVRSSQGEVIEVSRQGTVAIDLMRVLNKSNNTVKSMERRALEWLQTQPEGSLLIGSITGTPD